MEISIVLGGILIITVKEPSGTIREDILDGSIGL